VIEHCRFLKELNDAQALRRSVASALERASAPGLSEEERRRMLTFVVVGGGPTGVEYCGELSDFLVDAVQRLYPPLVPYAQVVLVHSGAEVLPQFDRLLRKRALETLRARRVKVMLNARVSRVDSPQRIVIKQKRFGDGGAGRAEVTWDEVELNCGLIMWAAGTGPAALTETLVRRLVDCARTADENDENDETPPSPSDANDEPGLRPEFWARQWTANGQVVASNAVGVPAATPGRLTVDPWLRVRGAPVGTLLAIGDASACYSADGSLLPQTAQVAAQQGAYVARLLNRGYDLSGLPQGAGPSSSPGAMLDESGCELAAPPVSHAAAAGDLQRTLALRGAVEARPFAFLNLGLLAYLGGGEALSQIQVGDNRLLSEAGSVGFLLWRSVYVVKQVSPRTRFLVLFDWLKTKLFGRDITDW
jgi:NADH dehydrogenase FAD-containing subunit